MVQKSQILWLWSHLTRQIAMVNNINSRRNLKLRLPIHGLQKERYKTNKRPKFILKACSVLYDTSLQAPRAWIIEFEMSVHRICEIDPFWTKKNFYRQTLRRTHRRRRSNSSLDVSYLVIYLFLVLDYKFSRYFSGWGAYICFLEYAKAHHLDRQK